MKTTLFKSCFKSFFTILFKVSFLLVMMGILSGCRKTPKALTPIPRNEGAIVASGEPAGLIENSQKPPALDGGGTLNEEPFPIGSDIRFNETEEMQMEPSTLPERDLISGASADRESLSAYTIYFDYDRYSIRPEELAKVEAVADFLNAQKASMLKIEGHCDERGTEEYNRALGERRALSVREVLIRLGIDANRVSTESWGEDRPAIQGENEAAYAKNRRGEFILLRR